MDDEELSKLITASALAGAAEAQARDDQLEQERREREQRERDERDRQAQREREAVDRAAAKRRRRTEATAGSIAKLWLGVPYLIVVFGSFLMSLPDEPTLTSGMFLGLLKTVAIAVIAAAVVCWLSDYVLGRPRRWILAVLVAAGFSIGWAGESGAGGYAGPVIGAVIGYVAAALLSRFVPAIGDERIDARAPRGLDRRLGVASTIALLGGPLAVTQMLATSSTKAGERLADMVVEVHRGAWGWISSLMEWFDGMARVVPHAAVPWLIPLFTATVVLVGWRDGEGDAGQRRSRLDAALLIVVAVGSVVAIIVQWPLAVVVTGVLALVVAGIALGIGALVFFGG